MSGIDHAAQARRFAGQVDRASGDHLDTAQTAVADGLAGIIHALLAIREELAGIRVGDDAR